jgi:hypothetical protein
MQAIIVDCVSIVEPQLAPIIGVNLEMVTACPEDSQAASPTHSEVITSRKSGPLAACVAIVNSVFPTSHVRTATVQVLATSTLTKVEDIFSEETMTIRDAMRLSATCARNNPPVSSVRAMVPEKHTGMTTTLKHLNSHKMPPCTNMPSGVASAPSVQAIVVDCVPIVKPQLASIIRNNLEVVMA